MKNGDYIYRLAIWICVIVNFAYGSVQSKVRCSEEAMEVDIVRSSPQATIYLEHLKNYPDEACKPKLSDGVATFHLSLLEEEMMRCGLTRVVSIVTGQKVYYHRIIVEEPADSSKHTFTVKCVITEVNVSQTVNSQINLLSNQTVTIRRRSLPDNFTEPEVIGIIDEFRGSAPVPILNVGVRQGGNLVTGELNVSPGTPLQMEINLDPASAPIYGILVTYMQVADTKTQEETIIFNGCSVDPYLFENFNTIDGDFLNAKFRAFKFPESTYVQFRGTVNVCLENCKGIECSNGQVGYGRKRRSISTPTNDKNNVYKVTMSTIIKVDFDGAAETDEALLKFVRTGKNVVQEEKEEVVEEYRQAGAPVVAAVAGGGVDGEEMGIAKEVREQFKYSVITTTTSSGLSTISDCNNKLGFILVICLSLCSLFKAL